MLTSYSYTPYIWPMLASVLFFSLLGIYAWRHRGVPSAFSFAVMMIFPTFWSIGAAMMLSANDLETKIFWFKFLNLFKIPSATAEFCFVLQYCGLGRLLTRRNLILLSIPALLSTIFILTNNIFHLIWTDIQVNGEIDPVHTNVTNLFFFYFICLFLVEIFVLIRFFIRSPQHRWPVALILSVFIVTHALLITDYFHINPFAPMDPVILSWNAGAAIYALAIFVFQIFDPVPLARTEAIRQMQDGMLVLDTKHVIVYSNPAAEKILSGPSTHLKGKDFYQVVHGSLKGIDIPGDQAGCVTEITLRTESDMRAYSLRISALMDDNRHRLGSLVILHDVTDEKLSQAQLIEQQQVLATLQERERLARELHDNAGQLLGYVNLQAQAIRKLVQDGEDAKAEAQLSRLANAAQEAHTDLRESISNLKVGSLEKWSFLGNLQQHLVTYQNTYAIGTELVIPGGLDINALKPGTSVQLFRVIQEALSNARKHGQAHFIRITFEQQDSRIQISITDDGVGFDPQQIKSGADKHFGLEFMSARMQQIGGRMQIASQPGSGARVLLEAPL
ncbi:MAG: PAS domain-containing protein [Anaerolineae bacterium]|nr:PAS domain-containing protein [Anaerolineae bacterium]